MSRTCLSHQAPSSHFPIHSKEPMRMLRFILLLSVSLCLRAPSVQSKAMPKHITMVHVVMNKLTVKAMKQQLGQRLKTICQQSQRDVGVRCHIRFLFSQHAAMQLRTPGMSRFPTQFLNALKQVKPWIERGITTQNSSPTPSVYLHLPGIIHNDLTPWVKKLQRAWSSSSKRMVVVWEPSLMHAHILFRQIPRYRGKGYFRLAPRFQYFFHARRYPFRGVPFEYVVRIEHPRSKTPLPSLPKLPQGKGIPSTLSSITRGMTHKQVRRWAQKQAWKLTSRKNLPCQQEIWRYQDQKLHHVLRFYKGKLRSVKRLYPSPSQQVMTFAQWAFFLRASENTYGALTSALASQHGQSHQTGRYMFQPQKAGLWRKHIHLLTKEEFVSPNQLERWRFHLVGHHLFWVKEKGPLLRCLENRQKKKRSQ